MFMCCWYVPAGHLPTVAEAMERIAHIREHGPTPYAFTFKKRFTVMDMHPFFLNKCVQLAEIAAQQGESTVGSVLVKDGRILGTGYEKSRQLKDISRHAEMVAILDALQQSNDLSGSVLYSNAEPCILCSYAIRHHKIATVVFSRYVGELGGTHAPCNVLTADSFTAWGPPPEIVVYSV
jgi:tRNA(adenine34) deaminase